MAKSRKRKNYKLRRRVMRTIAALTMVMAIVVAAIPVENYGTMRAAEGERTPWPDNYPANGYGDELGNDPLDGYNSNNARRIQEVRGGYLLDIAEAWAKNSDSGADAVIKGFLGTTGSTTLDVKENMYYNYVYYDRDKILNWVTVIQGQSENFTLQYRHSSAGQKSWTPTGGVTQTVTLPDKIDTENNITFGDNSVANNDAAGFQTSKSDFSISDIFTGTNAFFADRYNAYMSEVREYNRRVEELEAFSVTNATTEQQWQDFRNSVASVQAIWDDSFANGKPNEKLEVTINADIDFSTYYNFYSASFCNRVFESSLRIRLTGFTLENCYRSNDDGTQTEDIYIPKWDQPTRDDLGPQREKFVDNDGYLAAGSVRIVGIQEKAFENSQVTTVKLPNSIVAIGDNAFAGSRLTTLEFNSRNCKRIGDRAFYNCNQLRSINLTNSEAEGDDRGQTSIEEIGAEAFYGTGITEVVFPDTLKKIHKGCFAESELKTADFSAVNNPLEIADYAFYNCNLDSNGVRFPASREVTLKEAVFSVSYGETNAMESFTFPSNIKMDGDYILAGRTSLQNVTFPGDVDIKETTFRNCEGLACVTLGGLSYNDNAGANTKYLGSSDGGNSAIFNDVENTAFYVQGPGYTSNGSVTSIRNATLDLRAGLSLEENQRFYVPYMFKDSTGATKIEQKQKLEDGDFVTAEIKVTDENTKTAQLTNYRYDGSKSELVITVPGHVAGYTITSLGENCFEKVFDKMKKLIIEDGTLTEIGQGALKGAPKLEEVIIGNAVATIGADAFADCTKLEHVYFNAPERAAEGDWSQVMAIAPGAFKTNSKALTFHGVIKSDYAPFTYAMGDSAGFNANVNGKNICYQSLVELPESLKDADYDTNSEAKALRDNGSLKIVKDNTTGAPTLIDYPHLANMGGYVESALTAYDYGAGSMDEDQARMVNLALNIIIPEGVRSIDSKTYFDNDENKENFVYLEGEQVGGLNLENLYSKDGQGNDDDCFGGLFSGYFKEVGAGLIDPANAVALLAEDAISLYAATPRVGNITMKSGDYTENITRGNDHLTSIVLGSTVSGMPEKYAFDSCENLIDVTLGAAIQEIGKLPFRGCTSLENINCSLNPYYDYESRILYKKSSPDASGPDQIVECLESRGRGGTSRTVSVENDPLLANVTRISEEAFSNTLLNDVDLTGTKITQIPKDCFKGASSIQEIILPETVISIQEGALATGRDADTEGSIDVWVYDPNCDIDADAIGDESYYIIHGYEYTDNTNTRHTYVYNFCQTHDNVEFKAIEPGWTVRFRNHDGAIIKTVTGLANDQEIVPPDMDEFLRTNPYEGHVFDRWLWTDSEGTPHYGADAYANIRQDRDIYAQYKIATNDDYQFDGRDVTVNIVGGTVNGNGTVNETRTSIVIPSGRDIYITADTVAGRTFRNWSVSDGLDRWLSDAMNTQTTFTVPNAPESGTITITANFINGGSTIPDGPNPDGTYNVTVINGTGSGAYMPGATVTITATPPSAGATFINWTTTTTGFNLTDATATTTTFTMPASNVTVTANYTTNGNNDPTNPTTYTVTVNNGTGGGRFAEGATVTITANTPNQGASFVNWTTTTAGVNFASATSSTTTFTMPASNVTVTANFSDGGSGQTPGSDTTKKYKVTVNYGSGSGEYEAGATVNIAAYAPESSSRVFSRWTTNNSGLGFANANAATTSFIMPAADVTVTANYKTRTDDDDDDDSPSRRPGTNTNTTTVNNRPGSSTSTNGTTGTVNNPAANTGTTNNNNNGNRIYITKNGISNTDVASLAVSGSTDNFIVRITESAEATAAVEQALTNTYGSLNGLAYLPMDISLYDATGQNKITDTHGLNITVTMPIPDVLIQYGGNARVAAADNGTLQQLTPRFTTIDGIACISFVPPHFSPYVIYVDTNNLIAGQMLDATPATGDPIHPKWFAAIGMACISILLFVASDGRKRKNFRAA